jgi:predicted nucleotidyltransferase
MATDNLDRRETAPDINPAYYWWPITETKIRQAAQKIVDAARPEKIILFGSFAHGQPGPDSDVDLLVIMESEQSVHARSVQISEILYPRPFPVDIIVRTPAEVAERIALGDGFFREIMTRGRVIYERPTG